MEPGLAAGAYAAETVVEGAAAAALAISQSTAPLKGRYYRIPSPSPALNRSSHSLNVIKGRGYIFGGDGEGVTTEGGDNHMHIVTLPTNLDLMDTDYQLVPAVAKASRVAPGQEEKSEENVTGNSKSAGNSGGVPRARAGHCASAIGERIYVFGGSAPTGTTDPMRPANPPLDEGGKVYAFDTVAKTWEVLVPNWQGSTGEVPRSRTCASSSSIVHPLPIREETSQATRDDGFMTEEAKLNKLSQQEGEKLTATDEQQSKGYGTLFVHSGYGSEGELLRDVWAFDVASRIWSRWPDLPPADVDAGEGNITCVGSRLWRCGDGFGKMAHLDVHLNKFDDISGNGELGVSPKQGEWQVHSFGVKPGFEEAETRVEEKMGSKPTDHDLLYPEPRLRSSLIPITTGQGRDYLVLTMGEHGPRDVLDDVWTFQIASEKRSAAAVKDSVRSMLGRSTGTEQWAKARVPETNKDEGVLESPRGLSRFGSSSGGDSNSQLVIWGGVGSDGQASGDGWILMLE